jgi:NitT/TauT family transport system substrate-binding protein
MPRLRNLAAAAAATAAVAVALAACSSASTTSTGSTNAAKKTVLTVNLGMSAGNVDSIPVYIAQQKGYYTKEGLNVVIDTLSGGDASIDAALDSNSIAIGDGGMAQWVSDILRGSIHAKIVAQAAERTYEILSQPSITSVKQLSGKAFGISSPNAADQVFAEAVLAQYGVSSSAVTWVSVGSPASRFAAVSSGRVAAIEAPVTSLPGSIPNTVALVPAAKAPVTFISTGFVMNNSFLQANPTAAKAFIAATVMGEAYARANPAAAAQACSQTGDSPVTCQNAVKELSASTDPWVWSKTMAVDITALKQMIPAVAKVTHGASPNTPVTSLIDTTIAGTNY